MKLKPSQAKRNKDIQDDDFHLMDLMIFKTNSKYSGLFLELKVVSPFKKNGELKKNEHLENQQKSIDYMNKQRYLALFAWEFEMIKEIIDNYMKIDSKLNKWVSLDSIKPKAGDVVYLKQDSACALGKECKARVLKNGSFEKIDNFETIIHPTHWKIV